jgi:hypothetical protein
MRFLLYILLAFILFLPVTARAKDLGEKLSGRILLQVENNGEAWYINPENNKKYYMGRPDNAFVLMYELGIGITNENLEKIEIAEENTRGADNDGDGLSNIIEDAIGTNIDHWDTDSDGFSDRGELFSGFNPRGTGKILTDNDFAKTHSGKIFLQVENNGEAWYINPVDHKRYFLGRPDDAFSVMRNLGLGISNVNLNPIPSDEEYIKVFNDRLKGIYDDSYNKIISAKDKIYESTNETHAYTQEQAQQIQEVTNTGDVVYLEGKYSVDQNNVYYNGYILEGADPATFQTIDDYYSRDKDRVYIEFGVISGADPATFEVMGFGYSRDKKNAYYKYKEINGVNVNSFRLLDGIYALDAYNAFIFGNIIGGVDVATYSILTDGYSKDSKRAYYVALENEGLYNVLYIDNVSVGNFIVLSDGFARDNSKVYKDGREMSVTSISSFRILNRTYSKDSRKVFAFHSEITGVSISSFEALSERYARDRHHVYEYGRKLEFLDSSSFEYFNDSVVRDDNYVYVNGAMRYDIDASSFTHLGGSYFKDNDDVYYDGVVMSANTTTFKYISFDFARDRYYVYYGGDIIDGADPATIEVLNKAYSRDVFGAFYENKKIQGVNTSTFEIINDEYARDRNYVYHLGEVLPGANPITFVL